MLQSPTCIGATTENWVWGESKYWSSAKTVPVAAYALGMPTAVASAVAEDNAQMVFLVVMLRLSPNGRTECAVWPQRTFVAGATLRQIRPPDIRARHGPRIPWRARMPTHAFHAVPRDLRRRAETRMTTTTGTAAVDEAKLQRFVGQAVLDMGAAISGLLLHIGDRSGPS
jgi:hypothetical protein